MKTDNTLKKHHFWFLLGVVPLLTLIGVVMINSKVGGKIEERRKAIDDANKAIAGKRDPKPESLIKKAGEVVATVEKRQGGLHQENWNRQKYLFTWPDNSKLKKFDQMDLKFGDKLPTAEFEFDEFRKPEVYLHQFSSLLKKDAFGPGIGMADKVAPTQFYGGWQKVLRHVTDWGQAQITKDQVWLVMEDIWVQRSMLDAIRAVNAEAAAFRRAVADKDGNPVVDRSFDESGNKLQTDRNGDPVVDKDGRVRVIPVPEAEKQLKVLFRNRTWAVELEVVKEGADQRLTGKLTNLTDRLQLMGTDNRMILKVWFSRDPSAQPMYFRLGGEYLAGRGAKKVIKDKDGRDVEVPGNVLEVVPTIDHVIKGGGMTEIVRVEQMFDVRTVPIKRIDALELGKLDSRYAAQPLLQPKFLPEAPAPAPADMSGGAPGGMSGSSLGPPPGPGGSGMGPPALGGVGTGGSVPGGPATGGGQSSRAKVPGGGPIVDVIDGNKKRYLTATDQVRRMPVGIVVVVDQSYLQDVLMAFANSPLRFQITQVAWTRFRGKLDGTGPSGTSTGPNDYVEFNPNATNNVTGPADPDAGSSLGPKPPAPPTPGGMGMGGSSLGPPPLPGSPMGPGPKGPGPVGMPPGMGGFGGFGPSTGGPTASTVSESQITSGLIELSIYGVISLYEKYEPAKAGDATAAPGTPGPTPGPAPAPAPGPTTPGAKMRRRVRAR